LLALTRSPDDGGRLGWIAILFVQSLPYWAAVACRFIERRRPPSKAQPAPAQRVTAGGTQSAAP
jgi:hypothetical protein